MVMFNSYVKLPEGKWKKVGSFHPVLTKELRRIMEVSGLIVGLVYPCHSTRVYIYIIHA